MAPKKVKVPAAWNAKPVTKAGGSRGSARNPQKPYAKPPAKPAEKPARWEAKTNLDKLKEAAKTKPATPAPRPGAKATGTTGSRSLQAAAKPNSKATAPASNTRPGGGITMPNSARAGVNLPKVGARAERTAARVQDLKAKATAPKPSASTPKPAAGVNRALSLGRAGTAATVLGVAEAALGNMNNSYGKAVRKGAEERDSSNMRALQNIGVMRKPGGKPAGVRAGTASGRTGRGGTAADVKPTSSPKPKPASVADYKDAQGNTYDGNSGRLKQAKKAPAPSPAPTSSNRGGSSPTPSRSSTPVRRPAASPAPMTSKQTGDKAKDMETWRKANPALAKALDERQAKKQSGSSLKISSKFDTKSDVYTPSTKVDGSKLDTNKIDQKKVSEYKRRKDRYYS